MYEIGNKEVPQMKIGDYLIVAQSGGKIWIQDEGKEGGDGGEFPEADVAALIKDYYDKNL